jgi:hypothetical protein
MGKCQGEVYGVVLEGLAAKTDLGNYVKVFGKQWHHVSI